MKILYTAISLLLISNSLYVPLSASWFRQTAEEKAAQFKQWAQPKAQQLSERIRPYFQRQPIEEQYNLPPQYVRQTPSSMAEGKKIRAAQQERSKALQAAYAQEAAQAYRETMPKQPSWYARNIKPYIESWKQRTAPALETAQPYTVEGYEVAMKPEYAQYRQKLPQWGQAWKQRTAPILETYQPYMAEEGYEHHQVPTTWMQQAKEKFSKTSFGQTIQQYMALRDINKNYPGGVEEYVTRHPYKIISEEYQILATAYKKGKLSPEQFKNEVRWLAIYAKEMEASPFSMDSKVYKFVSQYHPEVIDELWPELENISSAFKKGEMSYEKAREIQVDMIRDFMRKKIISESLIEE